MLPIPDASVRIVNASNSVDSTKITGVGSINQTDWGGGGGQVSYDITEQYFAQDGNIEDSILGTLSLRNAFGNYASSGILESSTIDTGEISNFHNLFWSPLDQNPNLGNDSVKFQIATNEIITPTSTWTYIGPDGTDSSWYTVSNTNINSIHDDDRYIRYKTLLATASSTLTPSISDVSFTYTSSCIPPGQVYFDNINSGVYDVTVTKSGYQIFSGSVDFNEQWKEYEVLLSP
jgi:hypothetical protein